MSDKQKDSYRLKRKMHQNKSSDKKAYQKYKEILGDNAPISLEEFQKIKYNDKERYYSFKKDYKVFKAIDKNSKILQENKQRAKDLYYDFKNEGIYASDHFVEQYIYREYKNNGDINYDFKKIVEIAKKSPNYIDTTNGRDVIYYDNIGILKEEDKYITIIKGRVSKRWKKIE